MVSETGPRVVRFIFLQGAKSILPKGQTKILGPASVTWDQISEMWCQKSQPGNPVWQHDWWFKFLSELQFGWSCPVVACSIKTDHVYDIPVHHKTDRNKPLW